jgi:hypothetical protein
MTASKCQKQLLLSIILREVGRGVASPERVGSLSPSIFRACETLFRAFRHVYDQDIRRLRRDMDFMFEWQKQYLTSERSERVRYCF